MTVVVSFANCFWFASSSSSSFFTCLRHTLWRPCFVYISIPHVKNKAEEPFLGNVVDFYRIWRRRRNNINSLRSLEFSTVYPTWGIERKSEGARKKHFHQQHPQQTQYWRKLVPKKGQYNSTLLQHIHQKRLDLINEVKQDWKCFPDLRPRYCTLRPFQCWDHFNAETISMLRQFQCWDNFNAETISMLRHCSTKTTPLFRNVPPS